MAVFVVALLIPPGWGLAVFGVGVATFVVVLLNNPAYWLRRSALACFGAAGTMAATPRIAGALDLGSLGVDSLGLVIVDLGADVWIIGCFLATGIGLAGIDAWKSVTTRALPAASAPPTSPPEDDRFSAPLRVYLDWQAKQPTGLNLVGVGGGDIRLELDEVYVPLRLTSRREDFGHKRRAAAPSAGHAPHDHDFELAELFARLGAEGLDHAVLLGAPGSGKTTALRKLVQLCLGQDPVFGLDADTLVVFVRLRRFQEKHRDGELCDFICGELGEVSRGELTETTLRALWGHGRLLLLLDGLDEIADPALRVRCCTFLKGELRKQANHRLRVLVSCRYTGYETEGVDLGDRFAEIALRPLDAEQARTLIHRWFGEAAKRIEHFSAREAGEQAAALANALDDHTFPQRLKVMYSTPLLLTLLCVVVQQGRDMPRRRAAFYEECLRVLLQRWHRGKAQGDGEGDGAAPLRVEYEVALALLRPLAYELHREEKRQELDGDELVEFLQVRLKALARSDDPYAVLEWLKDRSGVLVELAQGQVGFFHLGVQEYLAARHIRDRGGELVSQLAQDLHLSWWHEVARLFVGGGGQSDLVGLLKPALRHPDLTSPDVATLLRQCIDEAAEVDLSPILAELRRERDPGRLLTLMGLVQGRRGGALAACAEELAKRTEDSRVGTTARSLAATAATTSSAAPSSRVVALLMTERDRPAAEELAELLRRCCVTVWRQEALPSIGEINGQKLHKEADAAVLVAGAGSPWEERGSLVRVFASATGKALYGARVRGSTSIEGASAAGEWFDLRCDDREEHFGALAYALLPLPTEHGRVVGDTHVDATTGIRFLYVPKGSFVMGSPGYEDATPHRVEVSAFWVAETPVTNASYELFLRATGRREPRYWRESQFSDPQQPVVGVTWEDAMAFCAWLSETSRQWISLPSEAQWEYAARSDDGRPFPWGDELPDGTRACYNKNAEGRPARVGSYPAGRGPFGALDQAGNVWEWCLDVWDYAAYAKHASADPVALEGDENARVVRGGGWLHEKGALAATWRRRGSIDVEVFGSVGFRVVLLPGSR